jgi:co-chaperonin GroES (HSP10)
MIKLIGRRLLIKRFSEKQKLQDELNAKGTGLIIKVDDDKERKAVEAGEIVDVGSEMTKWQPTIGQKIYFNAWAGDEITHENKTYLIVHEDDILAVYN